MPRTTDMNKKNKFGIIVCKRLSELGITQTELASDIFISKEHLNAVLNGRYFPSLVTVQKISKAIDIDIGKLTESLLDDK